MASKAGTTVLIGGGAGMIGRALSELLDSKGYEICWLSRYPGKREAFPTFGWDTDNWAVDMDALTKADVVINLAGAGIADERWTAERKKILYKSRVATNRLLVEKMDSMDRPPRIFISASATGYYGDRGDKLLSEEDAPGDNFLAGLVKDWEAAVDLDNSTGQRKVILRMGVVLNEAGGFLKEVSKPMKFGLGAWFGDGKQYVSWVHIQDLLGMYLFAIQNDDMTGVYNAVSDQPVRNREMVKKIKSKAFPWTILLPAPEFGLRLAFGEMADTLLDSVCVSNARITQEGFQCENGTLAEALEEIYGKGGQ